MDDRTGQTEPRFASGAAVRRDFVDDLFHRDALALAEQSAGIGVWSIDLTTGLVRGTAQFFRIMGLEPTDAALPLDVFRALRHPDDRERVLDGFRSALENGTDAYEIEYRITRPDGSTRWIFGRGRVVRDTSGKPVRYSGVDLDITDRKAAQAELAAAKAALERMNVELEARVRERTAALEAEAERRTHAEARLHQAQKMEAVGQLTGGLAHDFNNILQVIIGNLELVTRLLAGDKAGVSRDRVLAAIASAQRSASSAKDLVNRMLGFSRLQNLSPTTTSLDLLVADMSDMIRRTLGETIDVEILRAAGAWSICVDRNQLEAALLNLVVNARDAMPDGGSLAIETANVRVAPGESQDDLPAGAYAMLCVRDTGCGIPGELLPKVFDPFFTTKDTGKGSGLGLSMVYGFVTQSDGHVRIASTPGVGTSVRIYLPRAQAADTPERSTGILSAAPPSSLEPVDVDARGEMLPARPGERILLVEDNPDVRRYAAAALEQLGYQVLQAPDAAAALRLLDSGASLHVDAIFTDVVLPGGISGPALVQAARKRLPDVPVLYTSGYAPESAGTRAALAGGAQLLMKPYRIEALAAAIRRTIDVQAGSSTPVVCGAV